MMRYHWGLGVGHLHTHQTSAMSHGHIPRAGSQDVQINEPNDNLGENENDDNAQQGETSDIGGSESESDDPELTLEDRDFEGWDDVESEDSASGDEFEDSADEEDFTGM